MPDETQPVQEKSLELMKFEEQMAKEAGLPSPKAMSILKSVCKEFVDSGFAPTHFKERPAALFMAAMRGRELGLSPAESIFETFWAAPGGRLGMYANKMLDLMHRGGVKTKFTKLSSTECEIVCTPPGDHEPYTAYFHIDEAKAAGLVKPDSNWVKWPLDMCKARAVSRAYRALSGAFQGGGNFYSKEELEDIPVTEGGASPASPEEEKKREVEVEAEFNPGRMGKPNGKVVEIKPDVDHNVSSETRQSDTANEPPVDKLEGSALWSNASWVKAKIVEVYESYGYKNARTINEFAKAFLGKQELPKGDPTIYEKPLIALMKVKPNSKEWELFLSNPVALGIALSGRMTTHHVPSTPPPPRPTVVKHPAQEVFDALRWDPETQNKAIVLHSAIHFENAKSFRDYCKATGLDEMSNEDARAYCRIVARVLDATNLLRLSENFNLSISQILADLEATRNKRVEDIMPVEIQTALEQAFQRLDLEQTKDFPVADEDLPFN